MVALYPAPEQAPEHLLHVHAVLGMLVPVYEGHRLHKHQASEVWQRLQVSTVLWAGGRRDTDFEPAGLVVSWLTPCKVMGMPPLVAAAHAPMLLLRQGNLRPPVGIDSCCCGTSAASYAGGLYRRQAVIVVQDELQVCSSFVASV